MLKLLMAKLAKLAKLFTLDFTCLPSAALLDRREEHLECSVISLLDRSTTLGGGSGGLHDGH